MDEKAKKQTRRVKRLKTYHKAVLFIGKTKGDVFNALTKLKWSDGIGAFEFGGDLQFDRVDELQYDLIAHQLATGVVVGGEGEKAY